MSPRLESAAQRWVPGVDLATLRAELGARLDDAVSDPDGLALAWAALRGVPAALEALDQTIRGALAALPADVDGDEAAQRARERLLVGGAQVGPRLAEYAGRGALGTWVRVVVTREGLQLLRARGRERRSDDEVLADHALPDADPEVVHLKRHYRAEFRAAFGVAWQALSPEERTLLRWHYLDDLSIDAIGGLLAMHRATAARRLVRVRERLLVGTHDALATALGVAVGEVRSILRLIHSELDVSLRSLAQEAEGGPPAIDR